MKTRFRTGALLALVLAIVFVGGAAAQRTMMTLKWADFYEVPTDVGTTVWCNDKLSICIDGVPPPVTCGKADAPVVKAKTPVPPPTIVPFVDPPTTPETPKPPQTPAPPVTSEPPTVTPKPPAPPTIDPPAPPVTPDPPAPPAKIGNPGNDKPVGHAGECPNGNCDKFKPDPGTKGASDGDKKHPK